uniref:U40-Austrotoxin-Ht1h_1 n=1 Tax=Hickmania troglodytes TaxID=489260 RepID=A0A482Z8V3_9ARAC
MKVIACMMLLVAVACATMVDKDEIQQNMMEEHMEDTAESGVQMRACAADNIDVLAVCPAARGVLSANAIYRSELQMHRERVFAEATLDIARIDFQNMYYY